jgi:microcystin-dependent protein
LEGTKTDIVDVSGVHPVGTIVPFSGEIADIPLGWLLCDGSRREKSTWSELYSVVKQNYYAEATIAVVTQDTSAMIVVLEGDRNLQVNDAVRIDFTQNGVLVSVDTNITAIVASQLYTVNNTNGGFNSFDVSVGGRVKIYGRTNTEQTAHTSIFFVPNFRSRVGIGASTSGNDLIANATLGIVGGVTQIGLTVDNLPQHSHRLKNASVGVGSGDQNGNVGFELDDAQRPNNIATFDNQNRTTAFGQVEGGSSSPFSILQPYIALHWIIRAYRGMSAMILSGHNHYDRHIRYDDTHTLTDANRSLFRSNARVLRRDGDDTFHGKLTITGGAVVGVNGSSLLEVLAGASFGGGATFNGAFAVSRPSSGRVEVVSGITRLRVAGNSFSSTALVADILIDNGISGSTGWNALATMPNAVLPADAAIKIRGGSSTRASIALFNDNGNGGTSDRADVRFFGRVRNNTDIIPIYAGGVYGTVQVPALNSANSEIERSLTLEVGMSASAAFPLGRRPVLELRTNGNDQDNENVPPTITIVNGLVEHDPADEGHSFVVISGSGKLKKGAVITPASSLSNSSSGGPNFLANGPIRILSIGVVGGSVSSSLYHNFTEIILPKDDEGLDIVPNTATALILESHLYSNGTSSVQLQIAKNTSTHPYPYLINAISAGSGADAQTAGGQSTIPFDYTAPNSKIYWRLYHPLDGTNDLNGWINLVGYY